MGVEKRTHKRSDANVAKRPRKPVEVKPKVFHAFKQAKKAADKAKTFEIQKLVKRLKNARSDKAKPEAKQDVPALEAQLQLLKDLSNDFVGHVALLSKIRKDKALASNEEITAAIAALNAPPTPDATSRDDDVVRSRVLSSKHLASAIHDALAALHSSIGQPFASDSKSSASAQPQERDEDDAVPSDAGEDDERDEDEDEDVNMADDVVLDDADDGEDGVDADGWESGSVDGDDGLDSGDDDHDNSTSSRDDSDDDPPPPPAARAKPSTKTSQSQAASSSVFLPSLSVGFTRGDSDDDWSDGEAKVADGVRKNRRGQRARQAIWEKKYGRNATHVKKRQELDARAAAYAGVRGRGRGGARGAPGAGGRGRGGAQSHPARGAGSRSGQGPAAQSGRVNVQPSAPTSKASRAVADKPMHPSWEAKQKQKAAVFIQPSQGKKIVFE
ncbi:Bud-site selection protein [Exidia glandulosa HHB12029]|uniref:Bud-site selection protein n=1 Tax=Exidia glandulosa HHB12029 TaxID=1314781 RepID=A0A165QB54_EXIGL|nr:Bud-site selection protein [Exidia glandulosa HHB12029]